MPVRFKDTSKSGPYNKKDMRAEGKGKSKGKNSVNKVTTPIEPKEPKEPKEPRKRYPQKERLSL